MAVAQAVGITVGYLPGLSMRRIADLTPGSARTDAKDAAVIADAARTMPHTLRAIDASDQDAAALSMLTGFDLDLARQDQPDRQPRPGPVCTQTHPALETVLGTWLDHDPVLEVIATWPTPADLRQAGTDQVAAVLRAHGARRHAAWAAQIVSTLDKQTVVVAGTDAAGVVLPHPGPVRLTTSCTPSATTPPPRSRPWWRPTLLTPLPWPPVPGVGVRTAAVLLAETLGRTFDTGARLACLRRPDPTHPAVRVLHPR